MREFWDVINCVLQIIFGIGAVAVALSFTLYALWIVNVYLWGVL